MQTTALSSSILVSFEVRTLFKLSEVTPFKCSLTRLYDLNTGSAVSRTEQQYELLIHTSFKHVAGVRQIEWLL